MKTPVLLAAVGAALIGGALAWWASDDKGNDQLPEPAPAHANLGSHSGDGKSNRKSTDWPLAAPESREPERVGLPPVDMSMSAATSMAMARNNGDPRMPPLDPARMPDQMASAADRADPKAYARFEANQHTQMLASFVDAAAKEVPKIRADIERGRQMGVSAEQIAVAQEKARLIEQMSATVLREHPEIAGRK